jgi:hypothetical protein
MSNYEAEFPADPQSSKTNEFAGDLHMLVSSPIDVAPVLARSVSSCVAYRWLPR